jgi:hypothetical protein
LFCIYGTYKSWTEAKAFLKIPDFVQGQGPQANFYIGKTEFRTSFLCTLKPVTDAENEN